MKYIEIAESIIRRIKTGEIQPGDKLPTEKELIEKYNSSKMTVRKTLDLLREKGIVYSIKGSGTYISPYSDYEVSNPFNSRINGTTITSSYSSTVITTEYLDTFCKSEQCKKKENWFAFVHFYLNQKGLSVAYSISWIYDPSKEFTKDNVGGEKFENSLKEKWVGINKELNEVVMTKANQQDKNILHLEESIVPTTRTTYLDNKENPVVISILKHKPSIFKEKFSREIDNFLKI